MRFSDGSPIYQQIAELLVEDVLSGRLEEGSRLPSARELAASLEVNANTAARALQALADSGVARSERGTGYYVAAGGTAQALAERRRRFLDEVLPGVFRSLDELKMDLGEFHERYATWKAAAKKDAS